MRRALVFLLIAACAEPLAPAGPAGREDARPSAETGVLDALILDGGADLGFADAAGPDAETLDAGSADAGALDAGPSVPCAFEALGAADEDRLVLIGHRFGAMAGQRGTEVRRMWLRANGSLDDDGRRLDVGEAPVAIAFAPSGAVAFVLGESGRLVSVDTSAWAVIDVLMLPAAGFGELHVRDAGRRLVIVGSNVGATSGLSTVHVDCQGRLRRDDAAFFNLRLTESLAWIGPRAVLLGGQAVFAPVDPMDVRLVEETGAGFRELAAFDLWMDFVDAGRIAVSPDGRTLVMPNESLASNEANRVLVAEISGLVIRETARLTLTGPSQVRFGPDGDVVLVSQPEQNRVAVYTVANGALTAPTSIRGIGLAEEMALIERGTRRGLVLVPSVDPAGGPNVARLRIANGMVSDLGQVELGMGSIHIPGAIGVAP